MQHFYARTKDSLPLLKGSCLITFSAFLWESWHRSLCVFLPYLTYHLTEVSFSLLIILFSLPSRRLLQLLPLATVSSSNHLRFINYTVFHRYDTHHNQLAPISLLEFASLTQEAGRKYSY